MCACVLFPDTHAHTDITTLQMSSFVIFMPINRVMSSSIIFANAHTFLGMTSVTLNFLAAADDVITY